MYDTLGIVQVRHETRPESVVRKLAGKSLLEWVVRRATDCQRLDQLVVLLGSGEADQAFVRLVPPDVPVFVSEHLDALGRFADVIDAYPARSVVRICADNPFVDPVLIDRLTTAADRGGPWDYVGYCASDGVPAIASPLGVYAEWCRTTALCEAARDAVSPADREQVTRYLYTHPEQFRNKLIPVPSQLDREDVRLTINVEEDWEHAQVIYDALGPDELDWQRIAGLLDHQPALRKRMAVLNRAEAR